MKKLLCVAAGVAAVLVAGGCAQPGARPGAQAGAAGVASRLITSAPMDAALVTASFGYVVTGDQVLLTTDGGGSFRPVTTGLPVGSTRAAFFSDPQHGWVASGAGQTLSVARTVDGGQSWKVSSATLSDGLGRLSVSFNGSRGSVIAQLQSGGAFSFATVLATSDSGATWSAHEAPVAGAVSVDPDGRIWLAGGVMDDQLFSSTDQAASWTKPALNLPTGATIDGIAPPRGGLLPVALTDGGASRLALLRSDNGGGSWREVDSVALSHRTPDAPPLSLRASTVVIFDRVAARVIHHTAQTGPAADIRVPRGLPAGVEKLSFTDDNNGWALASTGACHNGKQDCSITTTVVSTVDGGTTWKPLLAWIDQIS